MVDELSSGYSREEGMNRCFSTPPLPRQKQQSEIIKKEDDQESQIASCRNHKKVERTDAEVRTLEEEEKHSIGDKHRSNNYSSSRR